MNFIDKIKYYDKIILGCVLFLIVTSIIAISSATRSNITGNYTYAIKQVIWFVISFIAMMVIINFDFSKFGDNFSLYGAVFLYLANITALVIVLIGGSVRKGSGRWISIGAFNAQPSEFAKVIMIICMAVFISKQGKSINKFYNIILDLIILVIPMLLIIKQPDLSTSIVFIVIFVSQMFIANIDYKYIIAGIIMGVIIVGLMFFDACRYRSEKDTVFFEKYQVRRVLALIYPEDYDITERYQAKKSVQAIGSGNMFGKGIYKGNLNKADYLPEPHTDFIFSIISEESGFFMALLILIVYMTIFLRAISIAMSSTNIVAQLIITGIVAMLAFQVFINIGVVTGIVPSTGIPLPFLSYGGSAMLTNMSAIGIILNIDISRKRRHYLI